MRSLLLLVNKYNFFNYEENNNIILIQGWRV